MALRGTISALLLPTTALAGEAAAPVKPKPRTARMVDWVELLPANERGLEEDYPQHDYLSESGPTARQYGSAVTNPKLNGIYAKIPGFVVPLSLTQQGVLSEFLLVPYYGACIHIPPPPPNQIVYGKLQTPTRIKTIWEPYWITGVLTATRQNTRIASAAYSIAGEKLELYEY